MSRLSIENVITWANAVGGWAVAWLVINLLAVDAIILCDGVNRDACAVALISISTM